MLNTPTRGGEELILPACTVHVPTDVNRTPIVHTTTDHPLANNRELVETPGRSALAPLVLAPKILSHPACIRKDED